MLRLLLIIALSSGALVCRGQFLNPLEIPDTLTGPEFDLFVAPSTKQLKPGAITETYGVNRPFLGPTLIMNQGDFVKLNVHNELPDSTTMHWHGMHVPGEDDGGPHSIIPQGTTWLADFTVLDEASTFWYHSHLHRKTTEHVYRGASGLIIVRDANEDTLQLPRTYGIDDLPLLIQDKTFDDQNQFEIRANGEEMMVNGTLQAYVEVPAQMVRLRLLNGSVQRVYNLGLSDDQPFWMIATDGALRDEPLEMDRLMLSVGERAQWLVDFSGMDGDTLYLMSYASEMPDFIPGGRLTSRPLDGKDFQILQFRVGPPTDDPITTVPAKMNNLQPFEEDVSTVYRKKVFDRTPGLGWTINGKQYDMDLVNDTIYLDDTEVWTLTNTTSSSHPFHIHEDQFFLLDINGNPPPAHMQGKKDVVLVNPGDSIRFITKFQDYINPFVPFMFHCHILTHEDAGMMGQFIVLDVVTALNAAIASCDNLEFKIYPNPADSWVKITSSDFRTIKKVFVMNQVGQTIKSFLFSTPEAHLDLSDLESGLYFVRIVDEHAEKNETFRLVKN